MNRLLTDRRAREYLERVRSKAFLLSTFLAPGPGAGLTLVPSMLMQRQRGKALRIAVRRRHRRPARRRWSRSLGGSGSRASRASW